MQIEKSERIIVGVNKFDIDDDEDYEPLKVDPLIEEQQVRKLEALRKERNNETVREALGRLQEAAAGNANVLYPMKSALQAKATGGEVANALREVWGRYQPRSGI